MLIESAVADRHRALWLTALGTGLRQGELLALRWEDVDLEEGRLRVRHSLANVDGELTLQEPKPDRSRRRLVLPEAVTVALRAHRTRQRMDRLAAGLTLGGQRARVRDDARQAAPRGDDHPLLPRCARSRRVAQGALP